MRAALLSPAVGLLLLTGCSGQHAPGTAPAASSGGAVAPVSCAGTGCSLTFTGDVTSVTVLGTQVTFGGVRDGRATLTVGGRKVTCRQGDSLSAGPLRLACTTVTQDRVTVTARLGG